MSRNILISLKKLTFKDHWNVPLTHNLFQIPQRSLLHWWLELSFDSKFEGGITSGLIWHFAYRDRCTREYWIDENCQALTPLQSIDSPPQSGLFITVQLTDLRVLHLQCLTLNFSLVTEILWFKKRVPKELSRALFGA